MSVSDFLLRTPETIVTCYETEENLYPPISVFENPQNDLSDVFGLLGNGNANILYIPNDTSMYLTSLQYKTQFDSYLEHTLLVVLCSGRIGLDLNF